MSFNNLSAIDKITSMFKCILGMSYRFKEKYMQSRLTTQEITIAKVQWYAKVNRCGFVSPRNWPLDFLGESFQRKVVTLVNWYFIMAVVREDLYKYRTELSLQNFMNVITPTVVVCNYIELNIIFCSSLERVNINTFSETDLLLHLQYVIMSLLACWLDIQWVIGICFYIILC